MNPERTPRNRLSKRRGSGEKTLNNPNIHVGRSKFNLSSKRERSTRKCAAEAWMKRGQSGFYDLITHEAEAVRKPRATVQNQHSFSKQNRSKHEAKHGDIFIELVRKSRGCRKILTLIYFKGLPPRHPKRKTQPPAVRPGAALLYSVR